MRTLVDIPDDHLRELGELSRRRKLSRAAIIREAVANHLAHHKAEAAVDAFGLWGQGKTDGMAYQEKIRGEW